MSTLGDDEVGLILDWVDDPYARKSLSLVCKQWLRVEGLTRLSIRVLDLDSFRGFIPRFPNLVTFECSRRITDDDLRFLAQTCPKIEALNLNLKPPRENSDEFDQPCDDVGDDGLCALAIGCRKLSKVLLRRRKNIGDVGVVSLINLASTLTNLDLGWCNLITDQALAAIGEQMYCLEELNMAECGPKITDIGGVAIATIQTLKRLNFSWLINVSDPTLFALAENCQKLVAVDFTGCELITGAGIRAFSNHTCLETLVFPSCYNIGVHDLENVVLGCRSLRCVVLDKRLKTWLTPMMQEYISIFCSLYWR
ncbi:hypothetical protein F2P56_025956 [Juglans regia]|uniref:COI1 F-box domain-containing protein n=1 Tax=Juglans regia TaxID=51240 RepID=A0A833WME6_JUGRE|nr:hypothetical protein F2P56_025956 [Juglans regia]